MPLLAQAGGSAHGKRGVRKAEQGLTGRAAHHSPRCQAACAASAAMSRRTCGSTRRHSPRHSLPSCSHSASAAKHLRQRSATCTHIQPHEMPGTRLYRVSHGSSIASQRYKGNACLHDMLHNAHRRGAPSNPWSPPPQTNKCKDAVWKKALRNAGMARTACAREWPPSARAKTADWPHTYAHTPPAPPPTAAASRTPTPVPQMPRIPYLMLESLHQSVIELLGARHC